MVVGGPISVEKTASPTEEQVDKKHAEYMDALRRLYVDYNPIYGDENVKLVID